MRTMPGKVSSVGQPIRSLRYVAMALLMVAAGCGKSPKQSSMQQYFLDCADGNDTGDGTTPATAWRSLERVNRARFGPGDSLLLKRGTRCLGMLWPRGSGSPGKPITLGAYGVGVQPVIDAHGREAGVRFFNQQYWHVENIAIASSRLFGVSVRGDTGVLRHFRIANVTVSGLRGRARTKRSGCVSFWPQSNNSSFADIEINGVWCHDSSQWAGIVVDGMYPPTRLEEVSASLAVRAWYRFRKPKERQADRIIVRNSIVHEIAGDGIVIFNARNALIENNAVWLTGMGMPVSKLRPKIRIMSS